jgi:D-sedoheptulose 7-phosphate isomerase
MHPINNYLEHLKRVLDQLNTQAIAELIAVLLAAREHGNKIFFMGNGGSGSTASHFATDLGKGTAVQGKPRFRTMPLNDHLPTFSAYANDMGYETVFAEQMKAFVERGDVVIGLSGSGNSRNVLEAMKVAREAGGICVGFTGFDGGQLKPIVDLSLHAPVRRMDQSEDVHHVVMHLICDCIRTQESPDQYPLPSWVVSEDWGLRVRRA